MLGSTAFVVYPNVLRAIDPSKSLTIDNLFRGKVQVSEEGY
jgi:hypothetical protein